MIFPEQKKNAMDDLVYQPEIQHRLNVLFHTLCVQAAKALVRLHEDCMYASVFVGVLYARNNNNSCQ